MTIVLLGCNESHNVHVASVRARLFRQGAFGAKAGVAYTPISKDEKDFSTEFIPSGDRGARSDPVCPFYRAI
jgi:hypothetical protein